MSCPVKRSGHSAVWHESNEEMLVFGGWNCGGRLNDLWRYSSEPDSEEPPFKVFPYGEGQESLWGTSYKTWEECDGSKQSPINIVTQDAKVMNVPKSLDQNYGELYDLHIENNGHALEVDGNFGKLTIGDQEFEADNFHFHTPGEHKIDGVLAIAEMHIVNLNKDKTQAAVIAIQFEVGPSNECLNKVLELPAPIAGEEKSVGAVDLSCFSKQLQGPWWNYQGSLTTPPCNEIVNWNVLKIPATICAAQLAALTQRFSARLGNNREIQDLNERIVTFFAPQ
jgi:carbonic anhydrase